MAPDLTTHLQPGSNGGFCLLKASVLLLQENVSCLLNGAKLDL